ncbi:hypothetical protein [Lysobacter sp. CA199]|uniref:hypothetical protein n=1 Tax=Lysobacter sp. CA199 TaxID=3455608 RepID=UPI003F8CF977
MFTEKQLSDMQQELTSLHRRFIALQAKVTSEFSITLTEESAREYALHGVSRRLGTIHRTVENIFSIFPPSRTNPLSRAAVTDTSIQLHAFAINVSGIQDNLAWVFVHEHKIAIKRLEVGLFHPKTQFHLPIAFATYLRTSAIADWHKIYAKDYRDALAHRIPLYVPPTQFTDADKHAYVALQASSMEAIRKGDFELCNSIQDQIENLGSACPMFVHSLSTKEGPLILHPQVISDALTVVELVETFLTHWIPRP